MRGLRQWVALVGRCWRAHPASSARVVLVLIAEAVAVGLLAVCLGVIVNAAARGDVCTVLWAALGGAVCFLVTTAGNGALLGWMGSLGERVGLQLDQEIIFTTAQLEHVDHLERPEYLDRVRLVLGRGQDLIHAAWGPLMSAASILGIGISVVLLARIHPALALMVVVAAVPLQLNRIGERRVRQAELGSADTERLENHLAGLLTHPGAGKELRVYGSGPDLIRHQSEVWRRVTSIQFRARLDATGLATVGWVIFTLSYVAGLIWVAVLVARGERTPGDMVLAVTLAIQLRGQIERSIGAVGDVVAGGALLESHRWLLRYAESQASAEGGRAGTAPPARLTDGIVFDRLSFRYPNMTRNAVHEVSFRLAAGTLVAVVGEYGSGKSTLVKLLLKLYRPDSGRISVDGIDLAEIDTDQWREATSAEFQDFGRYQVRLREAIGLGDLSALEDPKRVLRAASEAGADGLCEHLPLGLDTQLGRLFDGVDLSEGQWQKVALARALMRRSPLLLALDEPTAALDAPSEQAMFEQYIRIARRLGATVGTVTLVVSHRLSTTRSADLILMIAGGRVVEAGDHDSLMALNGRYADLFRTHEAIHSLPPRTIQPGR